VRATPCGNPVGEKTLSVELTSLQGTVPHCSASGSTGCVVNTVGEMDLSVALMAFALVCEAILGPMVPTIAVSSATCALNSVPSAFCLLFIPMMRIQ
jgi:hypothetical protein